LLPSFNVIRWPVTTVTTAQSCLLNSQRRCVSQMDDRRLEIIAATTSLSGSKGKT